MINQTHFPRHLIHNLHNLKNLLSISENPNRSKNQLLYLISHAASHGILNLQELINEIYKNNPINEMVYLIDRKYKLWHSIVNIPGVVKGLSNEDLLSNYYSEKKIIYNKESSQLPLVLVFTSCFNNFFFSNLALCQLLKKHGLPFLILKDTSGFNYLKGIPNFGNEFSLSINNLLRFIRSQGHKKIVTLGYSSGGYAALLSHLMIPESLLSIGYSIRSDLNIDSPLHPGKFFSIEYRQHIPKNYLLDLKKFISHDDRPIHLIYGSNDIVDKVHSENLTKKNKNVHGIELKDCGHDSPAEALINGVFEEMIALIKNNNF